MIAMQGGVFQHSLAAASQMLLGAESLSTLHNACMSCLCIWVELIRWGPHQRLTHACPLLLVCWMLHHCWAQPVAELMSRMCLTI